MSQLVTGERMSRREAIKRAPLSKIFHCPILDGIDRPIRTNSDKTQRCLEAVRGHLREVAQPCLEALTGAVFAAEEYANIRSGWLYFVYKCEEFLRYDDIESYRVQAIDGGPYKFLLEISTCTMYNRGIQSTYRAPSPGHMCLTYAIDSEEKGMELRREDEFKGLAEEMVITPIGGGLSESRIKMKMQPVEYQELRIAVYGTISFKRQVGDYFEEVTFARRDEHLAWWTKLSQNIQEPRLRAITGYHIQAMGSSFDLVPIGLRELAVGNSKEITNARVVNFVGKKFCQQLQEFYPATLWFAGDPYLKKESLKNSVIRRCCIM